MKELQELLLDLWKPNSVRSRYSAFKPVFRRFEGVEDEGLYNSLCRTIQDSKDDSTLIIDGNFAFSPRLDVLAEVKKEIPSINLDHITRDFLIMFADDELNEVYLRALNYVFALAKRNGRFKNRKQEENFICNMIVLTTQYLSPMRFLPDEAGKVILYDRQTLDEKGFWFLMLCHLMGMDVVVLEPGRESPFWNYDLDHLSSLTKAPASHQNLSFSERAAMGKPLDRVRTTVSTLSAQTDQSLFGETGIFKPWMYRGREVRPVLIDGTRIDLEEIWNREARLREGFKADPDEIIVPVFFVEVDGVDRNPREYYDLLERLQKAEMVLTDVMRGRGLFGNIKNHSEAVRLVFAMNPDGSFNPKKLKETEGYVFDYLSSETADVLIAALNRFIKKQGPNLGKEERIRIANLVLSMSKPLARMLENYDYPFQVPKVFLFLNREEKVTKEAALMLSFLSELGFDVAVFAPDGVSGLSDKNRTVLRLERMVYDMDFPGPPVPEENDREEKGLFRSVFDLFR